MANILLIDADDVARKAMRTVLARGGHRLAAVANEPEAWEFIVRNVKIDLVFMELRTKGGGLEFVRQLRQDCLLKNLPVVVYAAEADRASVRAALNLRVQNFLVKPYHDEAIFAEVAKALLQPWRRRHFEEEQSFCALLGLKPERLRRMLSDLQRALEETGDFIRRCAEHRDAESASARLVELAGAAEGAGAWGPVECVNGLRRALDQGGWNGLLAGLPSLELAARLVWTRLNPTHIPAALMTEQEREAAREEAERARWSEADRRGRYPVVPAETILREVEGLAGCPVVDGPAAMFQMLATGHRSSMIPLMEQVERDPGLAAQVLISANQLRRAEEKDDAPIEDLRHGAELLGELRLAALARGLATVEERLLRAFPFTWARFWMFQTAVARMSRLISGYLDYKGLESRAYVGGLLHDLGKLLFAYLHPFGWQAVMAHARRAGEPTAAAERLLVGCTAREMADRFAMTHGLPDCYRRVMRHLEAPEESDGDRELVAIVALARDVCRRNHLGHDGDQPPADPGPLEKTPAWRILGPKIFPGFTWAVFEAQMHASCQEIKRELHGWLEAPAA